MRDFMTRGGAISVDHLSELHRAADDLAGPPAGLAGGGPAVQTHAGSGEAQNAASGAARGFFALLTPEQKAAALAYDGPEDFGPDEFRIDPAAAAMRAGLRAHVAIDDATADALILAARVYVHSLWDHAVALAAEAEGGPMPLAGAEAWVEPDGDLRNRLRGIPRRMLWTWDELDGDDLSNVAEEVGLPRARLVPTPQRTEETMP